jgi:hypothetical protein
MKTLWSAISAGFFPGFIKIQLLSHHHFIDSLKNFGRWLIKDSAITFSLKSMARFNPATRTLKNSSRLLEKIPGNVFLNAKELFRPWLPVKPFH